MIINEVINVSKKTYGWLELHQSRSMFANAINLSGGEFPRLENPDMMLELSKVQLELSDLAEDYDFDTTQRFVAYLLSTGNYKSDEHQKWVYGTWLDDNKTPIKAIHFLYEALYTPKGADPHLTVEDEIEIIEKYIKRLKGEK